MTVFGVGQDLVKSYDNLFAHLEPIFVPQKSVTAAILSPSSSEIRRPRKFLSLEQQDEYTSMVRLLLPRLQTTASVRSATGINDLIDSGALQVKVATSICVSAQDIHADGRSSSAENGGSSAFVQLLQVVLC